MRRRGRRRYDDILTPREWQVLQLIAEGLTNEEIAARLDISFGGAKYHVAEILSKLGVNTREEAVALAEQARERRSVLALPSWPRLAKLSPTEGKTMAISGVTSAIVAGLALLITVVLPSVGDALRAEDTPIAVSSDVGPDLAPQGPRTLELAQIASTFSRTILLSKSEPQDLRGAEALIASLRRVGSVRELEAALTPEINLIVIDKSAAADVLATRLIQREFKAGRGFLGLNVCFDEDVYYDSSAALATTGGLAWEISPTGETTYSDTASMPKPRSICDTPIKLDGVNEPYFTFSVSPTAEEFAALRAESKTPIKTSGLGIVRLLDGRQLRYSLTRLDSGEYTDIAFPSCELAKQLGTEAMSCPQQP